MRLSHIKPVLKFPNSCRSFCEVVDLSNPDDVMNLYSTVAYYFAGEVQYARYGNIDTICADLEAGAATPLETVAQKIRRAYFPFCIWSVNQEILDYYRDDVQWTNDACEWCEGCDVSQDAHV